MTTTLLITASPDDTAAFEALDYAKTLLSQGEKVRVFFYGNGAYTANRLRWQSGDVFNVADGWTELASDFDLALPVCVGSALARGICDKDNAKRHNLNGDNIKAPFFLVGLADFALMIEGSNLVQF